MSVSRYAILVLSVTLATLILAWPLAMRSLDGDGRWAVAFGAGLAVSNTMAAHALVRWSLRRSTAAFLGAVLGGMVGRMALMLAAVIVGILVLDLPRLPLAVSVLSYFVLFLVVELAILQRQPRMAAEAVR